MLPLKLLNHFQLKHFMAVEGELRRTGLKVQNIFLKTNF